MNIVWLVILSCLWAPSFLFIKIALHDFPPLTLCAVRVLLGACGIVVFFKAARQRLPRKANWWWKVSILALFGNAIPFTIYAIGEKFTDSGVAAIINGSMPLFTLIIAHYFAGDEPMTRERTVGVLIGFVGILVLFYPEALKGISGNLNLLGMAVMLIAPICYAITTVFARRHLRGHHPLVVPTGQLIVATIYMSVLSLSIDHPWQLRPSPKTIGALLFLGIMGTSIASVIYFHLINRASATFCSLVTYVMPPAGVALGMYFLGERPGWNAFIGCAFILAGVVFVNSSKDGNKLKDQPVK
jgi:drug/metabolite transporter (DMT)-like permease